jgi:hypothetical protein
MHFWFLPCMLYALPTSSLLIWSPWCLMMNTNYGTPHCTVFSTPRPSITSFLIGPNICLRTLFSVWEVKFLTQVGNRQIIILYILMLSSLYFYHWIHWQETWWLRIMAQPVSNNYICSNVVMTIIFWVFELCHTAIGFIDCICIMILSLSLVVWYREPSVSRPVRCDGESEKQINQMCGGGEHTDIDILK